MVRSRWWAHDRVLDRVQRGNKRFDRQVLFHIALQKAEARKWNYAKESYQEYAMDKLALIYSLDLPQRDTIHLLISGMASRSLRATASVLRAESVDEFLEEMRRITSVMSDVDRKPSSNPKVDRKDLQAVRKEGTYPAAVPDRRTHLLPAWTRVT